MGHLLHSLIFGAALAFSAAFAVTSCTGVDEQSGGGSAGSCVGPSCNPEDAGRDQIVVDVPVPDSPPDSKPPQNACGTGCIPDDESACSSGDAPSGPADAGSPGDASSDGGDAEPDAAGSPMKQSGCGVTSKNGTRVAECLPAGSGETGSPCVAQSDCAPGLACVSEGTTFACRAYCCQKDTECKAGDFCSERALKASPGQSTLSVPVCVPADDCSLDEPYPCPAGKQCKCKSGTACAVVKDDGTTSCVAPGEGRTGDACPCAAGYVCSKSTDTCLKLCSTTTVGTECGSGKCLSVTGLPDGFGVCGLGTLDGG